MTLKRVDNVVILPVVTTLDLQAERVLNHASNADLEGCIVIGRYKDGGLYFGSSFADGGDVLWLMEIAKRKLMKVTDA